jgi:hypothetical protein
VVFQEHEQRDRVAVLDETARGAMTRRATIPKQSRARFALIEILRVCDGTGGKQGDSAEDEQTGPGFWLRHDPR